MSHRARNLNDLRRKKPRRSPYDRVLIICEGKKTEPYYLQSLVDDLKLNTANVEIDGDSDSSPRSVVSYAKKRYIDDIKANGRQDCFDRVYCVFDRDEHATYDEAINAILTATPKGVFFAITSNPCFEIWLLFHFACSSKPYIRTGKRSPGQNAEHELKLYLPNYQKGDRTIYKQLKEQNKDVDIAIANAKQVNNTARTSGFDNPTTAIPELIEYLRNLKNNSINL
jgi:hypothetical protein